MFCTNCSKLALLVTTRFCIKCHASVFNNISVLCENCSNTGKVCSVCLKKVNTQTNQQRYRGCGRCGKKQTD
jgi:hypothetical protein